MARTKQTARKSTGGKAPRKQLATTSAQQLRQFCTSQQNVGKSTTTRTDKTSYINHENTLGAFIFAAPTTSVISSSFEPLVSSAHDRGETWIGVNFRSVFDGTEGAGALRPRVRLRLVVSVDISGSMSSSFENDMSGSGGLRSQKIDVAKKCLMAIAAQLEPDDELGVVLFNHDSKVLIPLRTGTGSHASRVTALKNALCNVHAGGGTNLERGFKAGLDLLSRPKGSTSSSASPPPPPSSAAVEALQTGDERTVVSRCVFMTDMQSSQSDEDAVLAAAAAASAAVGGAAPVFTTVVGIGVDLSVGAVQSLSRTVGGRYASVCSAAEFERVTGEASSLVHDCVPVAYSISCSIRGGGGGGGGCVLLGGCGHPEAATLTPGSSTVTFSSEFATSGEGQSPILLRLSAPLLAAGDEPVTVEFQWQNWDGTPGFASVSPPAPSLLPAPPPSSSSSSSSSTATAGAGHPTVLSPWSAPLPHGLTGESAAAVGGAASERFFSDLNIRKALALTRFVDFQEVYMTDDRKDDDEDDDGEQTYSQPFRGRAQFRGRGGSVGRSASGHSFAIPQPSSSSSSSSSSLSAQERAARLRARAGVAARWAERAAEAKAALEAEVAGACGDTSVLSGGENQAFSDTLKQIVDLEGKDAEVLIKRAEELEAASEQAPSAARGKRSRSSSSKTVLLTGIEETGQRRGRNGSDDEGSGSGGDDGDDHQSRAAKKRSEEGVTTPALGAPAAPSSGFGCVLS